MKVTKLFIARLIIVFIIIVIILTPMPQVSALNAWNISSAVHISNITVSSQENSPQGVSFRPDGLKFYIIGLSSNLVSEYNLTQAWNISTASYFRSITIVVDGNPTDISMKSDGLKMYTLTANASVYEYNLSMAWNVSSAVKFRNVAISETAPSGLFLKADGLKMYTSNANSDLVSEYNLSTAWNISSATYLRNVSIGTKEATTRAVTFSTDGVHMYIAGTTSDTIYEYNLSQAWNSSSAVYLRNISVSADENNPQGLFLRDDGYKMYMIGNSGTNDKLHEYDIGVVPPSSSCAYGGTGNWLINNADNCIINIANVLNGDLITHGVGTLTLNSTINRTNPAYKLKFIKNDSDYGTYYLGQGFKLK